MAEDTMPYFSRFGAGFLLDYELVIRRYADIVESPGKRVPGVLWHIEDEYQLKFLDRREGYTAGSTNNLYDRIVVEIETEFGMKKAYIYKMEKMYAEDDFYKMAPDFQYINWMKAGRLSVNLPIDDLEGF